MSNKIKAYVTRNPHQGGGYLLRLEWLSETETGQQENTEALAFRTLDHARSYIGELARKARPQMQRVRLTQTDENTWEYRWRADGTFRP